jgi:hypothetical protein
VQGRELVHDACLLFRCGVDFNQNGCSAVVSFRKPGQIYEQAIKIVNLVKGLPVGVMTCGSGGSAMHPSRRCSKICGNALQVTMRRTWIGGWTRRITRWNLETTVGFIQYAVMRTKTVGGPIEIAVIKHEGFKWVQRKHFFSAEFNP